MAQENLGYKMDSFSQQIFIPQSQGMPSFGLGTGDVTVNRQTWPCSQEVWGVTFPGMFNLNHLYPLPTKIFSKICTAC